MKPCEPVRFNRITFKHLSALGCACRLERRARKTTVSWFRQCRVSCASASTPIHLDPRSSSELTPHQCQIETASNLIYSTEIVNRLLDSKTGYSLRRGNALDFKEDILRQPCNLNGRSGGFVVSEKLLVEHVNGPEILHGL